MSISRLLSHWRAEATIGSNIVEWKKLPGRAAKLTGFPVDLHPTLSQALISSGIHAIYSHQKEVWDHVRAGNNPVIVTGTASGKTLAYNLPILDALLNKPLSRGLYLFPTKALAQDQESKLRSLLFALSEIVTQDAERSNEQPSSGTQNASHPLPIGVYDGDTPTNKRAAIRKKTRLVISNPDMLHAGILPHHTQWVDFFQHLDYVVIDEIHTYRGVFGSHVANVIRRLKRICRLYKSNPQFILTSATIANPSEFASRLIEEPVVIVNDDGSGLGPKYFLIYNPPIIDQELGIRTSALLESVRLTSDLLVYDIQTIIFGRTRRTIEVILTYLREGGADHQQLNDIQNVAKAIRGYRGGYLPQQRREIEHGLRSGDVRLVVATNALELGIDIGKMGASVLTGYPGTIAATWQQAGRAGRAMDTSLAILITTSSPVDQFLAHHPDYFFERSPEQALINPDNLLILLAHLRSAAFEKPFDIEESFGGFDRDHLQEFLDFLTEGGELHSSGGKYFWMSERYPAESVSLRSASSSRVLLQTDTDGTSQIIGEVDHESATWMVHPQAVYLHEAQTYLVEELDLTQNIAQLTPRNVDYYTQPKSDTTIEVDQLLNQAQVRGANKSYGDIIVTTRVTGFRKIKWITHERFDQTELDLPPSVLQTTGYWLAISNETVEKLRAENAWNSYPNRYGANWSIQRDRARARDSYQCQICGTPESSRAHDVHHKIPFRTLPSYELVNRLDNLITLCPTCHRKAEAAVRVRSGLAGLAYALGNLAPLFLMCDSRDLGLSSDPKSDLSGGLPTIIIYDRIPAGIGLSEKLFEIHDELVQRADELVEKCECLNGCPSCVGPGGEDGAGGKIETLAILSELKPVR